MCKSMIKKYLNFLSIAFLLLGNLIFTVKADECLIFQNAFKSLVKDPSKYKDITNCCTSIPNIVTCENNHITEIKLDGIECTDLEEFITSIGKGLPQLVSFEVISGDGCIIPNNFPELKNLKKLVYKRHYYMASKLIPENISQMTNLEELDFSENDSTGEIPKSFGNLKNLKILNLSKNRLSDYVPYELGNLENLEEIYLSNNNLKGYLPKFSNIKICDYSWTNICILKSTTCTTGIRKKCTEEEINYTNIKTNNPKPVSYKDEKGLSFFQKVLIFVGVIIIIIVTCCCCGCCGKDNKDYDNKNSKNNKNNNNNNNNSTNNNNNDNINDNASEYIDINNNAYNDCFDDDDGKEIGHISIQYVEKK